MALCQEAGMNEQWMYDLRHRDLFRHLSEMFDQREMIDLITVQSRLSNANQLVMVGGLAYLSTLMDSCPAVASIGHWLEILKEKFILRQLLKTCSQVIARVYDHQGEVDQLVDEVERAILAISRDRNEGVTVSIKENIRNAIDSIQRSHQRGGAVGGLQTGITDLDKLTDGLHDGEMIVIAARPSVGKSSLAMNIAENVAVVNRIPVGVFTLEDTGTQFSKRMLCSHARVNVRSVRDGFLTEGDMRKLTSSAAKIATSPIHIDDTSGLSISQLRARARRMWQRHGIKLLIVDYLQLIAGASKKSSQNREQEVAEVSKGLKEIAKEFLIPVVVLSQLNRSMEKEKNRKPKLSDLRESGSIEQDADVVGMLYRPELGDDDAGESDAIPINLLIAKQRNGPSGEDVRMVFRKGITRFEPASKIQDTP